MTIEVDEDVASLVEPYFTGVRASMREALAALERAELEPTRKLAHNLIGTGGSFGFVTITAIGRDVQTAALAKNEVQIKMLLVQLADYIDAVVVVPRPVV